MIVLDTPFIVDHAYEIFRAISALLRAGGGPVGDMDEAIAAFGLAYDAAIVIEPSNH